MIPRWQPGRQGTGYRKLRLVQGTRWDAYLIDYPIGSNVPPHVDAVPGHAHWRVNLVVLGDQSVRGRPAFALGPLVVFRSDRQHEVARVCRRRVVLSIGVVVPNAKTPAASTR